MFQIVDSLTTTVLGCWMPITTVRALVIISINFLEMDVDMKEYVWAIQWAVWVEWVSYSDTCIFINNILVKFNITNASFSNN